MSIIDVINRLIRSFAQLITIDLSGCARLEPQVIPVTALDRDFHEDLLFLDIVSDELLIDPRPGQVVHQLRHVLHFGFGDPGIERLVVILDAGRLNELLHALRQPVQRHHAGCELFQQRFLGVFHQRTEHLKRFVLFLRFRDLKGKLLLDGREEIDPHVVMNQQRDHIDQTVVGNHLHLAVYAPYQRIHAVNGETLAQVSCQRRNSNQRRSCLLRIMHRIV